MEKLKLVSKFGISNTKLAILDTIITFFRL